MPLHDAQSFMLSAGIDAWLVHDFRSSNPILNALLPGRRFLTRRVDLVIPARGDPTLIVSRIDESNFTGVDIPIRRYMTWREYHAAITETLRGLRRVAMEYSPGADLPVVGIVDAGTVEFIRSLGHEVCSSADLVQIAVARWTDAAREKHARASHLVAGIKDDAFAFIRDSLAADREVSELQVQARMHEAFRRHALEWPDGPIVAINAHSGDPHFEPTPSNTSLIRRNDWVLIDLWARLPGDENIFSDITWVACCATPTERQVRVFNTVKAARDAALDLVRRRHTAGAAVQGWEIDEAAMSVLRAAHPDAIRHRTGHSLSPGPKVHGVGVNIDNTETHDTRTVLPGVGFTIEPGLYFHDFGVRLEINVFMDPSRGPVVTSCVQDEILRLA
jgi:Xaa-Pro dipeptidase